MDAHIPVLDGSHYLQALSSAPEGLIADSHFALMDFGDGIKRKACVKLYGNDLLVLNEIIGHVLAVAAEHRVPPRAAVMQVRGSDLGRHKPHWLDHNQATYAWCTELMEAPSMAMWLDNHPAAVHALHHLLTSNKDVPRIIAFDNWLANEDRNLGNLLQLQSGQLVLIDHGQIFGNCDWPADRPDPEAFYSNILGEALEPYFQQASEIQDRAVAAADQHYLALDSVRSILEGWLARILTEDEVAFAQQFLEQRASSAVYHRQLGVMT